MFNAPSLCAASSSCAACAAPFSSAACSAALTVSVQGATEASGSSRSSGYSVFTSWELSQEGVGKVYRQNMTKKNYVNNMY